MSAVLWNYSSVLTMTVVQLGYTAFTSRMVAPEGFGAFAAASGALTVFGYVAGAGLATYLLRIESLTGQAVRTAYRVAFLSGLGCCLAALALAPLCAGLWGLPQIRPVVQLFGLYFLWQPASLVATAALRRLDLARFTAVTETCAQMIGMGTGVVLLCLGWGPCGLVLSQVVTPAVTLVPAAFRVARSGLEDGPAVSARAVLRVSVAFAGSGLVQMTIADVSLWAVSRFYGAGPAGEFSRTALAVGLPTTLLCQGLRRGVMPTLARINAEGESLSGVLPDLLSVASALAFAAFGALAAVGRPALRLLLGPGWPEAGGLVPVFAVGAPLLLLNQFSYVVDEIGRHLLALLRTQVLVLAATVALTAAAVAWTRSLAAVTLAAAAAAGLGHLTQLLRWRRSGLLHPAALARPYAVHAAVGGLLLCAGQLASRHGVSPLGQVTWGLAGMTPVALGCTLARRWLPLYSVAITRGLVAG